MLLVVVCCCVASNWRDSVERRNLPDDDKTNNTHNSCKVCFFFFMMKRMSTSAGLTLGKSWNKTKSSECWASCVSCQSTLTRPVDFSADTWCVKVACHQRAKEENRWMTPLNFLLIHVFFRWVSLGFLFDNKIFFFPSSPFNWTVPIRFCLDKWWI